MSMYYFSAGLAIVATVAYHFFVKKIPSDINPIVSVIGIYATVLVLSFIVLPFFIEKGTLIENFSRLNWVQIILAFVVFGMELGFLLMYRYGWDLSVGNVVTGVFINTALMAIGILFLHEKLSALNIAGLAMCIVGVAMVGYRSEIVVAAAAAKSLG
ncbi:EamA family transporter [Paraburkholderia bannensis]|uniref:EamA family transporter n=1 Tax=Paraburkholderia bannensis TaxID=765414 RepID=UPI002ABE3B6E|nr:EamA family transporter [Paraburkholderia bannensis]